MINIKLDSVDNFNDNPTYPFLGESDGCVVLFLSHGVGVCLRPGKTIWNVGEYFLNLDRMRFKPLKPEQRIIIQNNNK